jgi:hypothetical protein
MNFNVDNVRVAKIVGSSLHENEVGLCRLNQVDP